MKISAENYSTGVDKMRIDIMDVYHEIHQHEEVEKKSSKKQRVVNARRGIEEYLEHKRLKAQLIDWWDEI